MTSFYYCYQTLQGFAFLCKLNLTEITNFKFERKNKMKCGISSKRRHRANGVLRSRLPEFISVVLIYDLFHINLSHYRCNLIIIRINSKIIWAHKLCIRLEILSIMKTVKCIPYQIIIPLERLLIQFVYNVFQLFTHGGQDWRKNFWSSLLRAKITHVVAIFNTQQGVFTPFLSK